MNEPAQRSAAGSANPRWGQEPRKTYCFRLLRQRQIRGHDRGRTKRHVRHMHW